MYFFVTNLFVDLIIHPLHLAQSRFLLQNRFKNCALYQSFFDFFRSFRNRKMMIFNGWEGNIAINFFLSLNFCLVKESMPYESIALNFMTSTFILYPFLTIIRRRECVAKERGMIYGDLPKFGEHVKMIYQFEGLKSFYRGFGGFFAIHSAILGFRLYLEKEQSIF